MYKLESVWQEAVVAYVEELPRHLLGGENVSQEGRVCGPVFKPRTL